MAGVFTSMGRDRAGGLGARESMGPHGETQPRKDTQGQANVHTPPGTHIAAQRDPETRLGKTPWPNKHGRAKYGATCRMAMVDLGPGQIWPRRRNGRRWVWPGAESGRRWVGQGQMCTREHGAIQPMCMTVWETKMHLDINLGN